MADKIFHSIGPRALRLGRAATRPPVGAVLHATSSQWAFAAKCGQQRAERKGFADATGTFCD
jgi:hypothetical protein